MALARRSGGPPFQFELCPDLRRVPSDSLQFEEQLHGSFAIDDRAGHGQIYYGLPGSGILRISADLTSQEVLEIPPELRPINFHSTKIGDFDGMRRLFLAANDDRKVFVVTLDGELEITLDRPEFEEYRDTEVAYVPTDTVPRPDRQLIVADGYGSNFITTANLGAGNWEHIFGGKTSDPGENGKFGTAHGMSPTPGDEHLIIADRPHSRLELYTFDGDYISTYSLPDGSRPCGINFMQRQGHDYAVVGSLDDPSPDRAAPIYVLDGTTYEVLSTIRPKEDLGVELADHLHNVIWHEVDGDLYLICQAWNPGHYFVLKQTA